MLEHVPAWLGHLLRDARAGHERLAVADPDVAVAAGGLTLSSPAFAHGARLPERFTADGEGISPPLVWSGVPAEATRLALIVEDADAPAARPLVHAIVWNMRADAGGLAEGAIVADGAGGPERDVGRNSFLREGWLPPDPPTGHGAHDYVFQLFALSGDAAAGESPGRGDLIAAMKGSVLAAAVLIGTYSRDEPASAGGARTAGSEGFAVA